MIEFDISALAVTLAEGGTYSFTVTPKAALSGAMEIRWVIVPKGKIPITNNDFSALEGTASFASGTTAAQTITITPTDDTLAEVSGEFELQVYQVVSGGDDILLDSQDVILTDDEDFSGVLASSFIGGKAANNFFFGGSSPLSAEGVTGDDVYVISRYQTGNVILRDGFNTNIIKFDYGVDISSARKTGRGPGGGEVLLGTDAANPTGTITWLNPTDSARWKYQLGDGDVLSWAEFLAALGPTTGTALTTHYTVASFAGDSVAAGNESASTLLGADADEVFSFGNDGGLSGEGVNGDDIYIITRYQTGNAILRDDFGTNIIKFDYGVDISSARKTGRGPGGGEVLLGTDAANPTAAVTWLKPAIWQYQIGDGAVRDWSEFLTALGPTNDDGELANSYTVGFLPIITTIGDDTLMVRVKDGETYVKTIVAIDGDGDDLTFSLSGARADDFEIDASGELRFRDTPEKDKYTLMVRVTDGSYAVDGRPPADGTADADTLFFKYSGGELSKTGDLVSVASGTITKANGATFDFDAQTGLGAEDDYSYIVVDDADSDGTYEARRVSELPTSDDYYALGEVAREDDKPTTYEPYYNDMINVEASIDVV